MPAESAGNEVAESPVADDVRTRLALSPLEAALLDAMKRAVTRQAAAAHDDTEKAA